MTALEFIDAIEAEYREKVRQEETAANAKNTEVVTYLRTSLAQEVLTAMAPLAPFAQIDAVPNIDKVRVVEIPIVIPQHRPFMVFAHFDGIVWNLGKQEGPASIFFRVETTDFYSNSRESLAQALVMAADGYAMWLVVEQGNNDRGSYGRQKVGTPAAETPPLFVVSQSEKQLIIGLRNMTAEIFMAGVPGEGDG